MEVSNTDVSEENVERSGHYSIGLLMHCSVNWPTNWIFTLNAPIFRHVNCGWYVLWAFVVEIMYGPDSITRMHEIYLAQHMEIAALHFIVIRYIACLLCERFIQKAISFQNSITRAFIFLLINTLISLIHFPSSKRTKSLKWWRRLFERFILFICF